MASAEHLLSSGCLEFLSLLARRYLLLLLHMAYLPTEKDIFHVIQKLYAKQDSHWMLGDPNYRHQGPISNVHSAFQTLLLLPPRPDHQSRCAAISFPGHRHSCTLDCPLGVHSGLTPILGNAKVAI